MKRIPIQLVSLIIFVALLLVACERPVPGSEPIEATATPVTLPTAVPVQEEAQPTTPAAGEETPVDENGEPYPAPGEGEGNPAAEAPAPAEGEGGGGNTGGGEQPSEPAAETTPTSYIVQPNDTLFSIASQFGLTVSELAAANNITDVNALAVGDTLTIPAPGGVTDSEQGGGQPSEAPATGQEQIHIVQAGENLFRIGLRYGFTVSELATYNNIANPNSIAVGQQIRIPAR